MAFKYVLGEQFKTDIIGIYDYVAIHLANPIAAAKLHNNFVSAIENACDFPRINATYFKYRRIVVNNYLLFYKIDEKAKVLTFYRALYGAMDFDRML